MKIKIILLITLVCLLQGNIHAQDLPFPNHMKTPEYLRSNSLWVWADDFGLYFTDVNNPIPTYKEVKMGGPTPGGWYSFREGNTAICHPQTGEVLFYKDATVLRNRDHDIILNGDGIYGDGGSGTQSEIIVPMPGDSNLHIVFSMMDGETPIGNMSEGQLYYSIVDTRLDSGKGGVVAGKKNKVVYNILSERGNIFNEGIITIPGDSGEIWLIAHGGMVFSMNAVYDSNYYVFKILPELDAEGLATGDINIEGPGIYPGRARSYVGRLKASPNRNWIFHFGNFSLDNYASGAESNWGGGHELVQFNSKTGEISNAVVLNISPHINGSAVGAGDFSPDGNVLHLITSRGNLKYSLLRPDSLSIAQSAKFTTGGSEQFDLLGVAFFPAAKLYNDKIYFVTPASNFVQTIENPNEYNGQTIVNKNLVNLQLASRMQAWGGDPSFAVYGFKDYSETSKVSFCATGDEVKLTPLYKVYDNTTAIWSDSSNNSYLEVYQPGTYWVKYYRGLVNHYYAWQTDTFIVDHYASIQPVISVDRENSRLLTVDDIYKQYQWWIDGKKIDGATNNTYMVDGNGLYHVTVTDEYGCDLISPDYEVTNQGSSIENLAEKNIKIYPNPVQHILIISSPSRLESCLKNIEGRTVIKKQYREFIDMVALPAGFYFLELEETNTGLRYVHKIVKE